jgi:hypothetical protein
LSEGIQIGKSTTTDDTKSINYKMGQKGKDWKLVRTYTHMELGYKIGVSHQQIQRYEQGVDSISIEKLCAISEYCSPAA